MPKETAVEQSHADARSRRDLSVAAASATLVAVGAGAAWWWLRSLPFEQKLNDLEFHVLLAGLALGPLVATLWLAWRATLASQRPIGSLLALSAAGVVLSGVLAWGWFESTRQYRELYRSGRQFEVGARERKFDDEAAWLASMADQAVDREQGRLAGADGNTFRFWTHDLATGAGRPAPPDLAAWLGAMPVPGGIAATKLGACHGCFSVLSTREELDVEPWRTLALPALALARVAEPGRPIAHDHQFRYASVGVGAAAAAFFAMVNDPLGSGERRVTWIELYVRPSGGEWRVARSELRTGRVSSR
ncbi:MAG: hypothetical protein IPG50_10360 [Myxococcales bacterium]|nr:hypothetical protein [Myxococcales bacterium]